MLDLRDEALERIETAVAQAEAKTSAEFVVVVARESGSYRDLEMLGGFALALPTLLVALLLSPSPSPVLLLVDLLLAFGAGTILIRRLPALRRLLAGRDRLREQLRAGAERAMHRQGVTLTRQRTSLLLYFSLFEEGVEFLADVGFDEAVSAPARNALLHRLRLALRRGDDVEAVLKTLDELGRLSAEPLPPELENPNEIPDRPILLDG